MMTTANMAGEDGARTDAISHIKQLKEQTENLKKYAGSGPNLEDVSGDLLLSIKVKLDEVEDICESILVALGARLPEE